MKDYMLWCKFRNTKKYNSWLKKNLDFLPNLTPVGTDFHPTIIVLCVLQRKQFSSTFKDYMQDYTHHTINIYR